MIKIFLPALPGWLNGWLIVVCRVQAGITGQKSILSSADLVT